jgi:hypothetical protein
MDRDARRLVLREFLKARRGRLRPADLGLRSYGRTVVRSFGRSVVGALNSPRAALEPRIGDAVSRGCGPPIPRRAVIRREG